MRQRDLASLDTLSRVANDLAGEFRLEPLLELIEQCLAQDPRPAYQKPEPERRYGAQFWDVDVRWHYPAPDTIRVLEVIPATPRPT